MITKEMLHTGPAPVIHGTDGSVNCVLVLVDVNTYYCKSNTYIPAWQISNVVWYNEHQNEYVGWYPLEFIETPPQDQLKECDYTAQDKLMKELFEPENDTTIYHVDFREQLFENAA